MMTTMTSYISVCMYMCVCVCDELECEGKELDDDEEDSYIPVYACIMCVFVYAR